VWLLLLAVCLVPLTDDAEPRARGGNPAWALHLWVPPLLRKDPAILAAPCFFLVLQQCQ